MQLIDNSMQIDQGMDLYDQCPLRGLRKVTIARITKTLIVTTEGARYSREGYLSGDQWRRRRLYVWL